MKKCLGIWKNDYLMQSFFRTSPHSIKLFQITCSCRCRSCGSRFLCSGSGWFLCSGSGWFLCSGSSWFLCSGSSWFLCSGSRGSGSGGSSWFLCSGSGCSGSGGRGSGGGCSSWFLRSGCRGLGRGRFRRASCTQFLCGSNLTIHFIVRNGNANQYKATQEFDPNHVSKNFLNFSINEKTVLCDSFYRRKLFW